MDRGRGDDALFGGGVQNAAPPRASRSRVPGWYPPLVGAWAGVFVLVATLDQPTSRIGGAVALALAGAGFFAVFRAPARTPPTPATATTYAALVVAVAVGAWALDRAVHPGLGAVLAAVLMTVLVAAYERPTSGG